MSIDPIDLILTFHGPFYVGGSAQAGIDRVLDRDVLLPGSSLKGLLRAEARERLGVSEEILGAIFGSPGAHPSPWWFGDAQFDPAEVTMGRHARIRRDANGVTERGFLMIGEMVWAKQARCVIEPMSEEAAQEHRLVLRAAARSVSAVGGGRRRGTGWVSIRDVESWTDADTASLLALRRPA